MARILPGYLPPVAALALTLAVGGLTTLVAGGGEDGAGSASMALLLPMPLLVSVAWGLALVAGRPRRFLVAAAGVWLAVALAFFPAGVTWPLAGNAAAGIAAGWALGLRWRLDAALAAVTVALLPALVWSLVELPPTDQLELLEPQLLEMLEQNLPAGASEADRARALELETEALRRMMDLAARIYPWVLGLGVLGQAGIILVVTAWGLRRLGIPWTGWGVPPFTRWRLPFYLVWVLVAGLGLFLTRAPILGTAGLNLALLAASVVCLQGLSVQVWVTARMMGPALRTAYWLFMGVFFAPLILASGVVLGLADQWLDIRRLEAVPEEGEPRSSDDQDD
jgi:hypothetical protein